MESVSGKAIIDVLDVCYECNRKECPVKDFVKQNVWVTLIIKDCKKVENS